MSWTDLLIGSGVSQRLVVVGTLVVYAVLVVRRPSAARESARNGIEQFGRLFTLVVAALLLASALGAFLPEEAVVRYLGSGSGPGNAVLAGLLGGVLLGGPYATYPIMQSVREQGAGYVALLSMYVGYSAVGVGRIPFGLVVFSPQVVALRVAAGVGLTGLAALGIWAVVPERAGPADRS